MSQATARRAAALALWVLACAPPSGPGATASPEAGCDELDWHAGPRAENLVLVIADTLRRDRLGAYGGPAYTPAFDLFAAAHLRFDRAYTQSPWTKPAVATLFTSLHPSQHGVASHPFPEQRLAHEFEKPAQGMRAVDVLAPDYTTLAEVLRDAGWRTGAVMSNPWLDRRFGFAQGFEYYDDLFGRFDATGADVSRKALAWLGGLPDAQRFFLYVHYIDPHAPYGPLDWKTVRAHAGALAADVRPVPAEWLDPRVHMTGPRPPDLPIRGRTVALLSLAYDQGVELFDAALGVLLAGLAARPDWARTAVLVTSDHGEALFERGYGGHGKGLFDEEVAIPLVARLPGVRARGPGVDCGVGLVDLMPLACEYLDVACPETIQGAAPRLDMASRYLVTEGVVERPRHRAIRNRRYKLSFEPSGGPRPEDGEQDGARSPYAMYDLERDPGETRNLLHRDHPTPALGEVARELAAALREAVPPFVAPAPAHVPVDPELEERLEALGYIHDAEPELSREAVPSAK